MDRTIEQDRPGNQKSSTSRCPVLVVGAGPTGLVLALELTRRGVACRIIDKNGGPGLASRAMVVQARTLEFYQWLGFAEEVVAAGVQLDRVHLRKSGQDIASINLNEMGKGLSPFPYLLSYPQDDHERFLVEKLRREGVEVQWGVELKEFTPSANSVRAVLEHNGAAEVCEVDYLCGCDGAHSRVRQGLGLEFAGGTAGGLYYVADVKIEGGFKTDGFMNLGAGGFVLMLPVRSSGMQRLIGVIPPDLVGKHDLNYEDIRPKVEPLLHFHVTEVNWFATYHVHHRVAQHFRVGRCFLAGDAGHIHSPVGGQGMNTGIGDAVNLAWKLADVLSGRVGPSVLDSYEPERIAFARTLVATTDELFRWVAGTNGRGWLMRTVVLPTLVPLLTWSASVRRTLFLLVSQIRIRYRKSRLSVGKAGRVFAGDRLPWVKLGDGDNFAPLRNLDWQVHVYGNATPALVSAASDLGLEVFEFPWGQEAAAAGLQVNALYLIRPDGHVALASAGQDPQALIDYAGRIGLKSPPQGGTREYEETAYQAGSR